jgi:uncharacterized membrane protein YkgB
VHGQPEKPNYWSALSLARWFLLVIEVHVRRGTRLGGFPALNPLGQFLIKDVVLLGVALVVTGECLSRILRTSGRRIDETMQR